MVTVINNPRYDIVSAIKKFFGVHQFDMIIGEKCIEFIKKTSEEEYPRLHFKAFNYETLFVVYSHIDFKNHSKDVVLYDAKILDFDSKLRKHLRKTYNKKIVMESHRNHNFQYTHKNK